YERTPYITPYTTTKGYEATSQPFDNTERETGIEPATFSLATRRSTAELLPQTQQIRVLFAASRLIFKLVVRIRSVSLRIHQVHDVVRSSVARPSASRRDGTLRADPRR